MADQKVQHILVKFLTEVDTKGVSASKGVFTDLDRQVQNITTRLKTAYDQAKKNKTDLSKIDFDLKSLKQFSDGLKKVSEQDLTKLAETEKQVFKQMLADTEKQVEAIEKEIKTGEKRTETLTGFLHGIDALTPLLGQHGFAVSKLTHQTLELIEAHKKGELATTGFGRSISFLKNPLVAAGAAMTALVSVAFAEAMRTNGKAADEFSANLEGLKAVGFKALEGLADGGAAIFRLFKGDFSKAKDNLLEAVQAFKSLGDAFNRGKEAGDLQNALEDNLRALQFQNAKLELIIAKNREIISEEATVITDIEGKRRALNILRLTEGQLAQNNLAIAKEERNVLLEKLRIQNFDLNNLPDAQADLVNKAEIKILQAQEAASNLERLINRLEKSINAQDEQLFNQQAERINKVFELAQKLKLSEIVDFSQLKADKDKLIKENEIQRFIQELIDLKNQVIYEAFGKKQSDIDAANQFGTFVDETVHGLTQAYDAVFNTLSSLPNKNITKTRLTSQVVKVVTDISKEVDNIKFRKLSLFERIFGLGRSGQETEKQTKEALLRFTNSTKDALTTFYDTEIQKTDFLIEQQQRRVDEINRIAADGNAEQLRLEEERLEKLTNQRETFAKRQQEIAAIEAGASTLSTVANYINLVVKESLFKDPILAIAESLALVAAIGAGIAQIRKLSVQGFETGEEFVTESGSKRPGLKDTIPALLSRGERVVPADLNAKLGKISNNDLVTLVNENHSVIVPSFKENVLVDLFKEQNNKLDENTKAIQDMKIHLDVDMDSYHVTQAKRQKGEARRKRLGRTG